MGQPEPSLATPTEVRRVGQNASLTGVRGAQRPNREVEIKEA